MQTSGAYTIIEATVLNYKQHDAVEWLIHACTEFDGTEMPLHIECTGSNTHTEKNHFLAYYNEELIGFMSFPPEHEIEAVGVVHHVHRRKGVGRMLCEAVKAACRLRGNATFLLVSEATVRCGSVFAEAVGGNYRFSEYRMELTPALFSRNMPKGEVVLLQCVGEVDLETLLSIQAAAFRRPTEEQSRSRMARWLSEPNQRLYLGFLGGESIGMLRVGSEDMPSGHQSVYINSFGILPECQGRGYGKQMLLGIVELLLGESWDHIRIEVNVENKNALSLYQSCGFVETSEYRYYDVQA